MLRVSFSSFFTIKTLWALAMLAPFVIYLFTSIVYPPTVACDLFVHIHSLSTNSAMWSTCSHPVYPPTVACDLFVHIHSLSTNSGMWSTCSHPVYPPTVACDLLVHIQSLSTNSGMWSTC